LDKPFSRPNVIEVPFYVLIAAVYAPILWMVLRCFAERLVIVIVAVRMAIAIFSWFVPSLFAPSLFNPATVLLRRTFLVLWIVAFLLSLAMPIQAVWHPYDSKT
jgi:predicted ferric reductase